MARVQGAAKQTPTDPGVANESARHVFVARERLPAYVRHRVLFRFKLFGGLLGRVDFSRFDDGKFGHIKGPANDLTIQVLFALHPRLGLWIFSGVVNDVLQLGGQLSSLGLFGTSFLLGLAFAIFLNSRLPALEDLSHVRDAVRAPGRTSSSVRCSVEYRQRTVGDLLLGMVRGGPRVTVHFRCALCLGHSFASIRKAASSGWSWNILIRLR